MPSVPKYLPALPVCPGRLVLNEVAATNAVVASCVVAVPAAAVGPVGVPVKAGDAVGALVLSCVWIALVTPAT